MLDHILGYVIFNPFQRIDICLCASFGVENFNCTTPELPGHGKDQTPVGKITLDSHVATVAPEIDKAQEKAVLVGHSMAGIVLSQVAERMPERVSSLLYASAYLLKDGQNILKASETAVDSLVGANLVPAQTGARFQSRREP